VGHGDDRVLERLRKQGELPSASDLSQEQSFLACSLNSRIGSTGPTSMKVTPPSVTPVCPAGQW
jgi:hypothetical protein